MIKDTAQKYKDTARTLLGSLAGVLVTLGLVDPSGASLLVGSALAFGTAFWQVYDGLQ